jgi:hypothetical protein
MFAQVTVTPVAASLAVVSALFALVFLRYGIPRAARNDARYAGRDAARNPQGTVGCSVLLCVGNAGLVVAFLWFVVECVTSGTDPLLFVSPCPDYGAAVTCVLYHWAGLAAWLLRNLQAALIVALIWYALSLVVLLIEMSAGRSRG